ncbi:unnamed protein product [Choristocarpus tenellus]
MLSTEAPAFVPFSLFHQQLQPEDDTMGLDLAEFHLLSSYLLNEGPDAAGHFYPPQALELPGEPLPQAIPSESQVDVDPKSEESSISEEGRGGEGITMGLAPPSAHSRSITPRKASIASSRKAGTSGTGSGTGAKRRASTKEEQQKKRRERNRVLARRTRLRKKYFFQSLQKQVASLQEENKRLKAIVMEKCEDNVQTILEECHTQLPSIVAESANQATTLLDRSGFLLMKALQSSQPSFCVTDPLLPDNPIVYASEGFIELTGYRRQQVLGRNCRFLQGPDTDPEAVAKIRKGVEEGVDTSVFLRQYKADGTMFWNHVFVAALRDGENRVINYVGIQHRMEKEPSAEVVAIINQEREEPEEEDIMWLGSDGDEVQGIGEDEGMQLHVEGET